MYTAIMELVPQNHIMDGLLGPDSITVVFLDPLGNISVHTYVSGSLSLYRQMCVYVYRGCIWFRG